MADSIEQEHGAETLQNYQDAKDQGQDFDFMDDFIDKRMPEEPIEGWRDFILNIPPDVPLWPGWDRGEEPPEGHPYYHRLHIYPPEARDKFERERQSRKVVKPYEDPANPGQSRLTPPPKTDAEKEQIKKDAEEKVKGGKVVEKPKVDPKDLKPGDKYYIDQKNNPVGYVNGTWKPESGLNAEELKQYKATKKEIQDKMGPKHATTPAGAIGQAPKYKKYQDLFKSMINTIESQGGTRWDGISIGYPPPKNHPFHDEYFELLRIFEGGELRAGDAGKPPPPKTDAEKEQIKKDAEEKVKGGKVVEKPNEVTFATDETDGWHINDKGWKVAANGEVLDKPKGDGTDGWVLNDKGEKVVVSSQTAWDNIDRRQKKQFQVQAGPSKKKLYGAGAKADSGAPPIDTSKWNEMYVKNVNDNVEKDVKKFAKTIGVNEDDLQWEGKDKYDPPPKGHPYYNRWMQIANQVYNGGKLRKVRWEQVIPINDKSTTKQLTDDQALEKENKEQQERDDVMYSWTNGPYGFKKWREFIKGKIKGAKSERWPGDSQGHPPPDGSGPEPQHPLHNEFDALVDEFLRSQEEGGFIPPDRNFHADGDEIKTKFEGDLDRGWRGENEPEWLPKETKPKGDWPKHFTENDKKVHAGKQWRVQIGGKEYSWDKLIREIKRLDDAVHGGPEQFKKALPKNRFGTEKARLEAMIFARNRYWDKNAIEDKDGISNDLMLQPTNDKEEVKRWETRPQYTDTESTSGPLKWKNEPISAPQSYPSNWTDEDKLISPGPNWQVVFKKGMTNTNRNAASDKTRLDHELTMTWEQLNNEIERLDKATAEGKVVIGLYLEAQKQRLRGYINARNAYWDWAEKEFGK
jgi:ribosomal protein L14E/L6E/L27E